MKTKVQISILFLTFCMSCNDDLLYETDIVLDEKKIKVININSLKYDFKEFMDPWKVEMVGEHLIVLEDRRISPELPLIHIIDINNWGYFKSKGVIGFGPGEIPSTTLIEKGFDDHTFFVYSSMDKVLSKFNINDSNRYSIDQFKQPADVNSIIKMFPLTDSTYIGISTNDSSKIIEFDKEGKRIAEYGEWQKMPKLKEFSNFNHFVLNQGWFKGDRELGLYVRACIFRDRLEVFNYKSKGFKVIDGPDLNLPEFENYGPNVPLNIPISNPFRYRDVSFSSRHIYALYGGINDQTIRETGEIARKIFVFSHSGEPLAKLNLDRSIQGLVINEKKGEIYGLTNDKDPGIAVFKIPTGFF